MASVASHRLIGDPVIGVISGRLLTSQWPAHRQDSPDARRLSTEFVRVLTKPVPASLPRSLLSCMQHDI